MGRVSAKRTGGVEIVERWCGRSDPHPTLRATLPTRGRGEVRAERAASRYRPERCSGNFVYFVMARTSREKTKKHSG